MKTNVVNFEHVACSHEGVHLAKSHLEQHERGEPFIVVPYSTLRVGRV